MGADKQTESGIRIVCGSSKSRNAEAGVWTLDTGEVRLAASVDRAARCLVSIGCTSGYGTGHVHVNNVSRQALLQVTTTCRSKLGI